MERTYGCELVGNITPSLLCTEDTPMAQQALLPAVALPLSPAVWKCWLCPVSKVYLQCCKSPPTQIHSQPVPNTQLKGSDLAAGLLLQLSIYKKSSSCARSPCHCPSHGGNGSTTASPSRPQSPCSHSTRTPSRLFQRTRWGQDCYGSRSQTP